MLHTKKVLTASNAKTKFVYDDESNTLTICGTDNSNPLTVPLVATPGRVFWGNIQGILSNQIDLQSILNTKLNKQFTLNNNFAVYAFGSNAQVIRYIQNQAIQDSNANIVDVLALQQSTNSPITLTNKLATMGDANFTIDGDINTINLKQGGNIEGRILHGPNTTFSWSGTDVQIIVSGQVNQLHTTTFVLSQTIGASNAVPISSIDTTYGPANVGDDLLDPNGTVAQIQQIDNTNQIANATTISIAGSATAWGSITGVMANQTDLQSALDNLQDEISTLSSKEALDISSITSQDGSVNITKDGKVVDLSVSGVGPTPSDNTVQFDLSLYSQTIGQLTIQNSSPLNEPNYKFLYIQSHSIDDTHIAYKIYTSFLGYNSWNGTTLTISCDSSLWSFNDALVKKTSYDYVTSSLSTVPIIVTTGDNTFSVILENYDMLDDSVVELCPPQEIPTYSIDPVDYNDPANNVQWTATRINGGTEILGGYQTLTEDITSFDVTFDGGDTHTFIVNWKYTPPTPIPGGFIQNTTSGTIYSLYDTSWSSAMVHKVDVFPTDNAWKFSEDMSLTNLNNNLSCCYLSNMENINNLLANQHYSSPMTNCYDDLTNLSNLSSVGDSLVQQMFYSCTSLSSLPSNFNFPQNLSSVGYALAADMFALCSNLSSLPDNFNLPQKLSTVGNDFALFTFAGCSSLSSLPDNFNLPQKLSTVGDYFAAHMFEDCSNLNSLPSNLNFPQNLSSVGSYFAYSIFYNCRSLSTLPSTFNLPQNLSSVGSNFADSMFYYCRYLSTLPSTFNLPQNLTTVGDNFVAGMFNSCLSLSSLPSNFNFPQNLNSAGDNFADGMFVNCSNLSSLPSNFNFPQNISGNIDAIGMKMFYNCTSLSSLPKNFNFPQNISSQSFFAYDIFYNCSNLGLSTASTTTASNYFTIPSSISSDDMMGMGTWYVNGGNRVVYPSTFTNRRVWHK